ncbi:hypothetical protein LCGC14_2009000 [marine sediment metagenome]|uniref:DUF4935 domain-containing protein n=1 Tax=marine sediment metagenome TaxID=412755 RepID=A0A0F9F0V7_9ZZZZ
MSGGPPTDAGLSGEDRMSTGDAEQKKGLEWPIAVFLDTNVLDALPESLESGELSNLVEEASRVFVPDVVAREWMSHRYQKAFDSIANALKASRQLRQYSDEWVKIGLTKPGELYLEVGRKAARRLRAAGLRVLRPPRIDTRDITARAVLAIPPFRQAGRGFKDELTVLSMLELLARWTYKSAVLVSKDHDFRDDLGRRFEHLKVRVAVCRSLSETQGLLRRSLDEAAAAAMAQRADAVLSLASQHWEDIRRTIEDSARSEGVSELELLDYFSDPKDIPKGARLRRLVNVKPTKLDHVSVGRKHARSERILVTVYAECKITIEVEVTDLTARVFLNRLTMEERRGVDWPNPERQTLILKRSLSVEATAREDESGNWSDLRLIEDKAEYVKLLEDIRSPDRGNTEPPS